jgi:signal transduction histidine kinase/DNA-binding response OmpR family regulator
MTTSTRNRRILVVEDSPTQAAEIESTLVSAGFEVDVAPDGRAGFEKLHGGAYDLVLADIIMPEMWGDELCRKIKADPSTERVPVILLTSLSEPTDVIEGLESGADNYITKPWVAEDLVRRVSSVLDLAVSRRAFVQPTALPVEITFMGKPFTITRDRRQVLEYFASAFEDYIQAKQREWESKAAEAAEREKREAAAALARVATELMASLDVGVTTNRLCQLVVEMLGCDRSHVFLRDEETGDYLPVAGYGATPFEWQSMRELRLSSEAMAGLVARLQADKIARSTREEAVPEPVGGIWGGPAGVGTSLYTALWRGGDVIGFQVGSYRDSSRGFSPRQEEMARGMAEIASLALDNARLHEELDDANRLKTEFVGTMSHELRTPLAVILGYCQLLLSDTFGAIVPEQLEALRRIECNAAELTTLVNAMLDLSRLQRGRLPVVPSPVDVAELMRAVEHETGAPDLHPGLEFRCEIEPDLPRLCTDFWRLKVILRNLIDNAFKFTERGSVTVHVTASDGQVAFAVTDTGIGITSAVLPTIFECFRQGHDFMTRAYGGVGLGLYVVQQMVNDLGGEIAVESEPGKGSSFRVRIPLDVTA